MFVAADWIVAWERNLAYVPNVNYIYPFDDDYTSPSGWCSCAGSRGSVDALLTASS